MMYSCVHTHSTFCDGKNTMEEMAAAAYMSGIRCFGFSSHSFVPLDGFGLPLAKMPEYRAEGARIKELYRGKMEVLCGLELDSLAPDELSVEGFDYIIGSAHSVRSPAGTDYIIDGKPSHFTDTARDAFGGSAMLLCKHYFAQLAEFILRIKPEITGHFDIVTKFNLGNKFFNEDSAEYKSAALEALDAVLETGTVIEVNTGAISRGYRKAPYPDAFLLKRVLEKGGMIIITSDAHKAEFLTAGYDEAVEILKTIGFKSLAELTENGFIERNM